MTEISVPSGAKVVINEAPFQDASALKTAVTKEFSQSKVDLNINLNEAMMGQDINVADFARIAALFDSSQTVNEAVMKCLIRCTYNGEKITAATFEPSDARQDYYPIILACMKENLLPFFKSLLSEFAPLARKANKNTKENQK